MSNAFQAPINAALSKFTGVIESSCISFTVGALSLFVVAVIIDQIGFLGVSKNPVDLSRIGGILFLAVGIKSLMK